MNITMPKTHLIKSLFLLLQFFSPSIFAFPDTICNNTPFPNFCRTLQLNNASATIHDYGRISLQHSLSTTQDLLNLVTKYLGFHDILSPPAFLALQDCQFLANLNLDFLSNTCQSVAYTDTLEGLKADNVLTMVSATLTNQETCLDGLQTTSLASTVTNALLTPLYDGRMLYSVSLALLKHGWIRDTNKGRSSTERWYQGPKVYQTGGRKLLQVDENKVHVNGTVVVNPDGTGNFTTIADAVAAAPTNRVAGDGYFLIYVVAGVYKEYVSIAKNKHYLMMVGDGIGRTIITGDRNVVDGWTTFNSATFAVVGQGFVAVNITFRNTAGATKHQAVAVRNGADLSTFYRCSFEGYQDTLYTHSLRQFYRQCDISGTVDFIFGNAAVVFQSCNLYPRLPLSGQFNAITAQGRTDINQNTGTSIHNCSIRASPELASGDGNGSVQTYLGRPWKKYSRTVYMQSFMDDSIDPAGWIAWNGDFALNTSYYGEYGNVGPGSDVGRRVTWQGHHELNWTDACNFTVSSFISGDVWLPPAGVSYAGGLV